MEQQARTIVDAMHATGLKRLIFISSMGIYGEVSGEKHWHGATPTAPPVTPTSAPPTTAPTGLPPKEISP